MNKNNKKSESALREEKVLKFWKDEHIFSKSLEKTSPKGEFVFYEGPPGANGRPHIGHLPSRAFKDAIPRYKTMQGYHVRRKSGWDTHGLPVELQVEKQLGLNSKKGIEEYGIAKFNEACKKSVWEYLDVWNNFTDRIGYWVDQKDPYVTYYNSFIESVWNVVKEVNSQNLLYKDYKVVPWCPRCGTALSSHELAQGYKDVKDLSVYAKFKVSGQDNTYIIAWTTTPWTLPGNVALAVGEDIEYVRFKYDGGVYITSLEFAKQSKNFDGTKEAPILAEHLKGKDLVGLAYEPLYPFLNEKLGENKMAKGYKIYAADFVSTEDGTGIVHTAVMYGQDDFVLGTQIGLPKFHLVNPEGNFIEDTGFLEGRFVKDEEVAVDIIKDLAHRGLLFKKEKYEHSYPHCWRCKTALIYYARDSWYIKMSDPKVKEMMIEENKKINWEPEHIRDGRFGEWLREIKDWAVSRERYWGTPLPVWECTKCLKKHVVGGVDELKNKTKKSGNRYFLMRHGEAENNTLGIYSSVADKYGLTPKGKTEAREAAEKLKEKQIDIIYSSPFLRTKETAEIVAGGLGISKKDIIVDERIAELGFGDFSGRSSKDLDEYINKVPWTYETKIPGGESLQDVKNRLGEFIYEVDSKYVNQNILIVAHGIENEVLPAVIDALNKRDSLKVNRSNFRNLKNGAFYELPEFVQLPHNIDYELDLHRPFIDDVVLSCDCGGEATRTKEVMDVWFDSGAMPFAQDHYPFENREWVEGEGFPADYICEGLDQTRGWFYTLHAIGILMGRGRAYKNVICHGLVNDAQGQKMSKSVGNVVDPFEAVDEYGVDTLRMWMFSVNQPGDSKNFDPKTVGLVQQQVFGLLYNVLAFYELYRDKKIENEVRPNSDNILDEWILEKLDNLIDLSTEKLDNYRLLEPTRAIKEFISDLSTWYLRRSRDRIKDGDKEAKQTLYFVLKNLVKVLAPFAPFSADDIWMKLRHENDPESVHLASWPKTKRNWFSFFKKNTVADDMGRAREVVSNLLKARQQKNLPVRQPLMSASGPALPKAYVDIVKDEVNIKQYKGTGEFVLDTNLTKELKEEGDYRELVRGLQELRKKMGLTPNESIDLHIQTSDEGKNIVEKFSADLKKVVLVKKIGFSSVEGEMIKAGGIEFVVKMLK